jgi:hypothetical protein
MKKTTAKKTTVKKAATKKKAAPAKKAANQAKSTRVTKTAGAPSASSPAPVEKQPQSNLQAAQQAGIFLHTDDAWSLAYFADGDLHCEERELFG